MAEVAPGPADTPGSNPHGGADANARAAAQLATLHAQIDDAQALLDQLMQDVLDVEGLQTLQAQQLLEANEQLVIAALRAQRDADTAAQTLDGLSYAAEHDPLTDLPNRNLFHDRLQQAIAGAARHQGCLALLFVDLDNFKAVNDQCGHAVGDQVLQQVAQRLLEVVRAGDTVCRHGGDEFLVLLTEVVRPLDAVLVADKLLAALAVPMQVDAQPSTILASIGISMYPDDAADARLLVQHADAAMYRAKRLGPGHVVAHGDLAATHGTPAGVANGADDRHAVHRAVLAAPDRLQASLREANERLVLAALDAQTLRDAAQQAQSRQSGQIAAVAEALRNPAAPVRIAAAMLGRLGHAKPLLPRLQAIVAQQVAQMARLVGDLLDVSRLGSGGLELPMGVVDMTAVVEAALQDWRPVLAARQQRLQLALPSGPLMVHGHADGLAQIVSNLLDNAAKYTPDHGEIALRLAAQADKVVLTISDNGIGITTQALPQIFEPFAQDPEAIGFHGVGLGIGLTVVRGLLQAMGGRITASSAGSRQGSCLVVTLLRAGAQAGPRH